MKFRFKYISIFTFFLLISFNSGDGGLSVFSPYIILTLCYFLFFCFENFFKGIFLIKKNVLFFSLLYLLTTIIHVKISNSNWDTFFRNSVILLSLSLATIPNVKNYKFIIYTIVFVLFCELSLRLFLKSLNGFSFYGLKESLIFPDTNFLGIFFVPIVIVCWRRFNLKQKFKSLSVLIFTMSRTTWIALLSLSFLFGRKITSYISIFFIIGLPIILFTSFTSELKSLDGSLSTKIDIFLALVSIESDFWKVFLFGLGREEAQEVAKLILGKSVYTGHTIPGNIFQYGIVNLVSFVFVSSSVVDKRYRLIFILYLLITGMTGLFPYSYLPLTIYGLKAAHFYEHD